GSAGNIATLRPVLSPMLWNSVATGKRPAKHGVHGFCEVLPDGTGIRPVQSGSRTCKALWNIASQAGLKSNVVGWYASHPAEPIDGVVVSNQFQAPAGPPDQPWPVPPGSVHPEDIAGELAELRVHPMEIERGTLAAFLPELRPGGVPDDSELLNPVKHRKLGSLMELIAHTSTIHTSATWLMQHTEWDFMAVYYEGIDRFAHEFMHFHPPRMEHVDPTRFTRYQHVMRACYRFHDMMLGATLDLVGSETTVVLLSDHGYHFDHLRPAGPVNKTNPVSWHHPLGVLAMAGPGVRRGQTILGANLLDVAPTVLSLLDQPYGLDMDGKPLLDALDETIAPRHVISWELIDGHDGRLGGAITNGSDPDAEQQAVQQLIDLGYIEPLGEDKQQRINQIRDTNRVCLIQSLMDAGDTERAEVELTAMLEQRPDHLAALELWVGCLIQRQAYDEAADQLDQLSSRGDGKHRLALLRAQIAAGRDQPEEAMSILADLQPDAASEPSFRMQTGYLLLERELVDEAESEFRAVLERDPNHPMALDGLAAVASKRGDDRAAAENCLAAVERLYFLPRVHLRLGRILETLGHVDAAIQATQVACHQAPEWATARRQLTAQLRRADRHEEATNVAFHVRSAVDRMVDTHTASKERVNAEGRQSATEPMSFKDSARRILVVSGLPRSGTSLMMQVLQAAGVKPFTDNRRSADRSNPKGYFEHEAVKRLAHDPYVLQGAHGQAVKVIHALVEYLPPGPPYCVIWMQRSIDEIIESQENMLQHNTDITAPKRDRNVLRQVYTRQAERILSLLQRRSDVKLTIIEHRQLIQRPIETVKFLLDDLDLTADIKQIANTIDTRLYRSKS
ncbi:MAG: alkaline phosphatase family protein, partial [Planctomycetota bacterium]